MEALPADFLSVLCCPMTRGPLRWIPCGLWCNLAEKEVRDFLEQFHRCDGVLLREDGAGVYPVRDGIPVLLAEEFVTVPEDLRSVLCGSLKLMID